MQNDNQKPFLSQTTSGGADNVWISREEYDRLRSGSNNTSQGFGSAATTQSSIDNDGFKLNYGTVATVVLAIVSIIYPVLVLILIPVAIVNLIRNRKKSTTQGGRASQIISILILTVAVIVAAPMILFIGMILLWQLNCAIDPSACRSV